MRLEKIHNCFAAIMDKIIYNYIGPYEILCLVIVNVNVTKYVQQKCQKCQFVAIRSLVCFFQ